MGVHWLLLAGLYFNDGRTENYERMVVRKEYCIEVAKSLWGEYFASGKDKTSSFNVICRNEKNHYDFTKVVCGRDGNCNI